MGGRRYRRGIGGAAVSETFLNGRVTLHGGDSRDVLKTLADNSVDSIVCDPPYGLVFMGRKWDTAGPDQAAFASEFWAECLRVLKPGGHVVAFSGTRTVHRMVCAIEDAGFEIRDSLQWLYGSGFPKSHNVSKGIDKAAGAEREVLGQAKRTGKDAGTYGAMTGDNFITAPATARAIEWSGWGTALKPACEPICLARKPLIGTVAANVMAHGTGAINVDGCRVGLIAGDDSRLGGNGSWTTTQGQSGDTVSLPRGTVSSSALGRWPANVIHDGSDEVLAGFPESKDGVAVGGKGNAASIYGTGLEKSAAENQGYGGGGSAARFFYTSKADSHDRIGSKHPTVKPVDLLRWLTRLVTPPNGLILDPFAGTGTTAEAAYYEGFRTVLIEREEEYLADIRRRMALCMSGPDERKRESIKAKHGDVPFSEGSLFA